MGWWGCGVPSRRGRRAYLPAVLNEALVCSFMNQRAKGTAYALLGGGDVSGANVP
jgi:hypothetical protein